MLYRKDLLKPKGDIDALKLSQKILEIYANDQNYLAEFAKKRGVQFKLQDQNKVADQVKHLVLRLQANCPPITWEEVFALCELKKCDLLIETQTFDTYISTYVEMVWNCGGDIEIN